MRTILIASVLTLVAVGSPALAQATDSDTADVAIEGNVTPLCVLGEPSQASKMPRSERPRAVGCG